MGLSSIAEDTTKKERPEEWRISAGRTEAEARISFMRLIRRRILQTRRLRGLLTRTLYDDGLLVFPESPAQRIGNFTDGRVTFYGFKNGGDKILVCCGAVLQRSNRRLGFLGIAPRAPRLQALGLLALDLRIDTQRRNRALFFRDEFVHAYDDLFLRLHSPLIFVSCFLDFALHKAA